MVKAEVERGVASSLRQMDGDTFSSTLNIYRDDLLSMKISKQITGIVFD